jgi:glutamyl-tRNA synthetase
MRELDPGEYAEMVADHLERSGVEPPSDREHFAEACRVAQDKAQTLDDVWPLIRFVFSEPVDDEKARQKFLGPEGIETLKAVHAALESVPEWSAETLEEALSEVVERLEMKPGAVYQPIRVAITGTTISPGIFDSLALLGRDESLNRLLRVI